MEGSKKKASTPDGRPTLLDSQRRLREVQADFARATAESERAAMEKWTTAYAESLRHLAETGTECSRGYVDAVSQFVASAEAASEPNEVQEAYRSGLEGAQSAAESAREAYEKTARELFEAWTESQQAATQGAIDAYRNYLRALQEEWSRLDVDVLVDVSAVGSA